MPNHLGYCGPDENEVMMEACVNDKPSTLLVEVLRRFEGAYPYLRFLAEHSGSGNPFDYRVAEAYWIGNDTLQNIPPNAFYDHLQKRFSPKFSREHMKKFFETKPYASFPHHSLHVFNAFSTMGTVPDSFASGKGPDDKLSQLMDKCRISWGLVVDVQDQNLVMEYEPLQRKNGKLFLGPPVKTKVTKQVNGTDFLPDARPGYWVSTHWGLACTILSPVQVDNLKKYTLASMRIANAVPVPG